MNESKPQKSLPFTVAATDERARAAPIGEITRLPAPEHRDIVLNAPNFRTPNDYAVMGRRLVTYVPPPTIESLSGGTLVPAMADFAAGDVYEHNSELYLKCSDKKSLRIANFSVRLLRRIVKISLNGKEIWLELELVSKRRRRTYLIPSSQFLSLAAKLAKDAPEFRLYPDSGKAAAHLKVYLSRLIEDLGETLEERWIYTYPGWQCERGGWHYFSGLDEGCECAVRLVDLTQISVDEQQRADAFMWHALDLGDPFVMVPLLVHLHSGVLHRLFDEAGLPIRFIFDLQGQSSIGKTMLMEMLCIHFDGKKRLANFQSTAKGIERFAEEHHDGLVVIDDLSSAQDKDAKKMLERILREVCNGSGRIVSAKGGKSFEVADVAFSVMMTSEGKADGLRQSSQYRILTVPMTAETLNHAMVEEFKSLLLNPIQGYISPIDLHMTRFIRWLEGDFDAIVRDIATFRPQPLTFQTPRHETTFRVLVAESRIVMRYFAEAGIVGIEDAKNIFAAQWMPILVELVRYNETLGRESDPVKTIFEVLIPGVRQELVPVAPTRETFELEPAVYFGFWLGKSDGIRLVLDPIRFFQWIQRQFAALHRDFPSTLDEILRKLVEKGLSEGYARKDRKNPKPLRSFKINGQKLNLLVLNWDAVQIFHEGSFSNGE